VKHFAELYSRLDETTSTRRKVTTLMEFFSQAPSEEKNWALALLWGKYRGTRLPSRLLREKVASITGIPLWLIEESYSVVGDLAETISLLLPPALQTSSRTLEQWIRFLEQLKQRSPEEKETALEEAWQELDGLQRFLFNKLITGGFRVGTGRGIVARALAEHIQCEQAVIAHRLTGEWSPETHTFEELLDVDRLRDDPSQPYPFFLASGFDTSSPIDSPFLQKTLGSAQEWLAEWKWDGIRGQLIIRDNQCILWSRGEEILTERFPEFERFKETEVQGAVLDGEVICMKDSMPLSFHLLQKRITRKKITSAILKEAPAHFIAYDILEYKGEDVRNVSLQERRTLLQEVAQDLSKDGPLTVSPLILFDSWEVLVEKHKESREHQAEGFMLKRACSPYRTGRKRGEWWKWKVNPFTVDGVLLYAQRGHGRRANLYTDFTFAVWNNGELISFAKVYSGLSDEEMKEVDSFVKKNTLEKFGPVRTVKAELVFEIAFEGIQPSTRHKSGLAVRFPRISRWRKDKRAEEADNLTILQRLVASQS
jgi:DNA ligase 1